MHIDRGIVAAIGAAVLFGLSTPLAKLRAGSVPRLLLAGLLYMGSGDGLALLLWWRVAHGGRASITWPRGADMWWLLGAIASGGAIGPCLLMLSLQATDGASASPILNLQGVFTALLAWFVFNENVGRGIALGVAPIVGGDVVLSAGSALSARDIAGGRLPGPAWRGRSTTTSRARSPSTTRCPSHVLRVCSQGPRAWRWRLPAEPGRRTH